MITLFFQMSSEKHVDALLPQHGILRLKGAAEAPYSKVVLDDRVSAKFVVHTHPPVRVESYAQDQNYVANVSVNDCKHGYYLRHTIQNPRTDTIQMPTLAELRSAGFKAGDAIPVRVFYSPVGGAGTLTVQRAADEPEINGDLTKPGLHYMGGNPTAVVVANGTVWSGSFHIHFHSDTVALMVWN